MKLIALTEEFSICKVASVPPTLLATPHVFIGITPDENSLVCPAEVVPEYVLTRDDGWKGFYIKGELDFSLIGVLSNISSVLAQEKIGIFVVSTYNTDYIFVKQQNFLPAINALRKNGMEISE